RLPMLVANEDGAAGDVTELGAGQRDRRAVAGKRAQHRATVLLDSSHPRRSTGGENPDHLVDAEVAAPNGSRHDGAGSLHRKRAIDWKTEQVVGFRVTAGKRLAKHALQLVESFAGSTGTAHDGRTAADAFREQRQHVVADERQPFLFDEVDLRQRYHHVRYLQQPQDREVFARLWHDAFVSRDYEKSEVDSAGTDDHAAHEILVAGHIDDTHGAESLERERRKPQIDGNATALFFGQPVGVDSRQRFHQLGLSMIDVSSRPDDHAALQRSCSHTANARSGRSSGMCASRNSRSKRGWDLPSASLRATE